MPLELPCPDCQKSLRAHDGLLGHDALCPFCRSVVRVPLPTATPTPTAGQPAIVAEPAAQVAGQTSAPAAQVDDNPFAGIGDEAPQQPVTQPEPAAAMSTPSISQVPLDKSEEEPLMPPSFDEVAQPAVSEPTASKPAVPEQPAASEPIAEFDFEPVVEPESAAAAVTEQPAGEFDFGPVVEPVAEAQQPVVAAQEPAAEPQAAAPAAEEMWWAQTADGQQYGPVPKSELDSWVADGSINAECQVLRDGDAQWQWASQVYSQLS